MSQTLCAPLAFGERRPARGILPAPRREEVPPLASPQLSALVESLRSAPAIWGDDLVATREAMAAAMSGFAAPADVRFEPVDADGVPAEWAEAPGARADRAVVYLHGGGYCLADVAAYRGLVARLSRTARARGLSVGYRLAPEHPHPAAVEDAVAAVRFVTAAGLAPGRVAVAGDSAGGGLVVA